MTSEGNVTNENFKIKFKCDFLVPPYDQDLFNKARKIVHNYLFSHRKLSILHCKVDLFSGGNHSYLDLKRPKFNSPELLRGGALLTLYALVSTGNRDVREHNKSVELDGERCGELEPGEIRWCTGIRRHDSVAGNGRSVVHESIEEASTSSQTSGHCSIPIHEVAENGSGIQQKSSFLSGISFLTLNCGSICST